MICRRTSLILAALLAIGFAAAIASAEEAAAPAPGEILLPTPSPRQIAWQEMETIAFAHFGVNTFTNKEWGDGKEDPAIFNPTEFDARQ
jgi:alpha-L-fucosidase